jgi:tetratricopeptide (TPR) repeat protein
MGLFDFLFGKKDPQDKATTFGRINEEEASEGMSFEQAQKMREAFLAVMSQDDEDRAFNAASGLMLKGAFEQTIEAYENLAEKYPDRLADCESQIGAAYHFLKQYDKAIACYLSAEKNGADSGMMDDNIWEACLAAFKKTNDKLYINKYLTLRPNGSYLKKANKLL